MTRKPTIYEALHDKLGREPTHEETVADVKRILSEGAQEAKRADHCPYGRTHWNGRLCSACTDS